MSDDIKHNEQRSVAGQLPPNGLREGVSARSFSFGLPETFDEKELTVDAVLATDGRVRVWDWERGVVDEILRMDGFTKELPVQIPMLDTHQADSVERVLGSTLVTKISNGELLGTRRFAKDDPLAERTAKKIAQGHITDGSIRYMVERATWIPEGETRSFGNDSYDGPVKIVTSWYTVEDSVTPIGADSNAKVRTLNPEKKEADMAENAVEPKVPTVPVEPKAPEVDLDAVKREAVEAERTRCIAVREIAEMAGLKDLGETLVAEGKTAEEARAALYKAAKEAGKFGGKSAQIPGKDDAPPESKLKDMDNEKFARSLNALALY